MKIFLFILLTLLIYALALHWGAESVSLWEALQNPDSLSHAILLDIRLPRILLAALVGAGLSVSGVAFQALLRNPLADPFILGVSGGAALGSALAVGFHLPYSLVSVVGFLAALASMFFIYQIAQTQGRLHPHTLLLVGVLFNMMTFALILLINSLISMQDLNRIWFLMVGSIEPLEWPRLGFVALLIAIGFGLLLYDAAALNLIPLGEESAELMGVPVEAVRRRVFFSASLIVGATVSVSGLIGFVGLATPHMIRLLTGSDHRRVLPFSLLGGSVFLVLADLIARTAFARGGFQTQIPVGVVTALIGAPLFFVLLKKK